MQQSKSQSPVDPKVEDKVEDMECSICNKTFPNETLYKTHMKTKHPQKPQVQTKPKPDINKVQPKSKGGFEQYQQDLQDKIFAFLGELGEKNAVNNQDAENNDESDKMIGQSNYLENTIVKTPYEPEFDVPKSLSQIQLPENVIPAALTQVFKKDINVLWDKLQQEKDRWEFCDPIELYKYEDQQFTLVNVPSVIRNYKSKGITLDYPQLAIFVLWLTKTCKDAAWKEFYIILAYTTSEYFDWRNKGAINKDKLVWKNFNSEYLVKLEKDFPKKLLEELSILKTEDVVGFLRMYSKWVSYFGLE